MDSLDRRASIAAYKERKTAAGIFAIRCTATPALWVGRAPDLATIWRRLSFELAQGSARCAPLQQCWALHGGDSLSFEVLETIEEDSAYVRDKRLAARVAHWRTTLGAQPV